MKLSTLKKKYPNASRKTWHKHKNGGGWVENTANVAETAYVGPDAIVKDRAEVLGDARIEEFAVVGGESYVYGHAKIFGQAKVGDQAVIGGEAQVGEKAKVLGNAHVNGQARIFGKAILKNNAVVLDRAQVFGNAYVTNDEMHVQLAGAVCVYEGKISRAPMYFQGSIYQCYELPDGSVQIGCTLGTLDWWRKHGLTRAAEAGFTPAQLVEYEGYLRLIEAMRPENIEAKAVTNTRRMYGNAAARQLVKDLQDAEKRKSAALRAVATRRRNQRRSARRSGR